MKFKGLSVILLSIVLCLIVLEGLFRVLERFNLIQTPFVHEQTLKTGRCEFDRNVGWRNKKNFQGVFQWPYGETYEKTNSIGARGPDRTSRESSDVFKISILGCSRAYGFGVSNNDLFTEKLDTLLERDPQNTFEISNFSVIGYGLDQMLLNYRHNVRQHKPNLVFLQLYEPNIYRMQFSKLWGTPKPYFELEEERLVLRNHPVPETPYRELETWLVSKSAFYRDLKDRIIMVQETLRTKTRANISNNEKLKLLAEKILKQLKEEVESDQAKLAVFIWGEDAPWIKEICLKSGVEYFNLENYAGSSIYFSKGALDNPLPVGHWATNGHKYVGSALYNYINTNKTDLGLNSS